MNTAEAQRQQLLDNIRVLPDEFFQEVLEVTNRLRHRAEKEGISVVSSEQPAEQATQSPYEVLKESGLIGCIKDGPSDLSTNYKQYIVEYLEQYSGQN